MDVQGYYRRHRRECEIAFYRSAPDRPVALAALVYANVHGLSDTLRDLLDRASPGVQRRYEDLLARPPE